jgi:hypothetical protein
MVKKKVNAGKQEVAKTKGIIQAKNKRPFVAES